MSTNNTWESGGLGVTDAKKPMYKKKNLIPISNNGNAYNQKLSNGTDQSVTYRIKHKILNDAFDPVLLFGNYYMDLSDTDNANDITVKASLEINGTMYPVRFAGGDSVIIKPGGIISSDPVGVEFKKGDTIYSRTFVSVATVGQKWPVGLTTQTADNEGKTQGDITVSGTPATTFEYAYSPVAILGNTLTYQPSVMLIGDSIMSGTADNANLGFAVRALNAGNVGWVRISMPGEASYGFKGIGKKYRIQLSKYTTHAIVEYGVNDLVSGSTLANVQSDLINIWNALAARGLKVFQTTITPKTTSTDSWATMQNQAPATPLSVWGGSPTSIRNQLNEWIRSCPTPLSGYFEVADQVETSRNSGIWRAGMTGDGTHPNSVGYAAMQSAINLAALT